MKRKREIESKQQRADLNSTITLITLNVNAPNTNQKADVLGPIYIYKKSFIRKDPEAGKD